MRISFFSFFKSLTLSLRKTPPCLICRLIFFIWVVSPTQTDKTWHPHQGGSGMWIPNQGLGGGGLAEGRKKSDPYQFDAGSGQRRNFGWFYSWNPHNPYCSVDSLSYGLSGVMGSKRSAKKGLKKSRKTRKKSIHCSAILLLVFYTTWVAILCPVEKVGSSTLFHGSWYINTKLPHKSTWNEFPLARDAIIHVVSVLADCF